ncbi:hypothetical protein DL764_003474 [Monosporascus ibericus]|uniref:Uncharacterized protein n=1 Tax=Monosporascus ibericus TaxID=155417 RepID=A0A4Q4TK37_9PEZI|nr:hypothetical protein DL764_003474 [Monosporascus ibericus]
MPDSREESLVLRKAAEVLKEAENLVQYLREKELPEPNFSPSSPPHPADNDYDTIRINLTEAAQDLILLAKGPMQWLRTFMCSIHDLGAWQTALRFKYFSILPLDQSMSVKDIAAEAKMDEDRLGRVMKLLASQHCFREVEEDVYQHTSLSAFIAQNKDIEAIVAFQLDEMFEAASLTAQSIERAPYTSDSAHTAFTLRFGTHPYKWYMANPERGARFASAMAGLAQSKSTLSQFPDLEFIVQDINPRMLEEGPKQPGFESVEKRVSFMQYDFLQPQPIIGAVLFFLRQVIHNYPDDICVRILKSLASAMEKCPPGTILLINDMVMPEANTEPKVEEHHLRQIDMAMLNGYAAKQRSLKEFAQLLKLADKRFEVVKLHGKGVMGLLEVQLIHSGVGIMTVALGRR